MSPQSEQVEVMPGETWPYSDEADECRFCGGMFEPDEMDDHECEDEADKGEG